MKMSKDQFVAKRPMLRSLRFNFSGVHLSFWWSSSGGLFVLEVSHDEKCDEHIWCKEAAQP